MGIQKEINIYSSKHDISGKIIQYNGLFFKLYFEYEGKAVV